MNSVIRNATYIGAARFGSRILGLISTFFVARLLVPDDYAVIAICMIIQDLALRLEDIGFGQNIVTKGDLTDEFIGSLLKLRLLIGILLFSLVYFSASSASIFFKNENVELVLQVISIIFLFNPLINVNITIAVRSQNFIPSIKTQVFAKITSVLFTLAMAVYAGNYWALALGMVVNAFALVLFSHTVMKSVWPLQFSMNEVKGIFHFSKWFTFMQLVDFFNSKASIFLAAKIFEQKIVGFLSLGSEICWMYAAEVSHAIDKANLSAIAEVKRNTGDIKDRMIKNIGWNLFSKSQFLVPVYGVFIVYPEVVISILLGNNWLEMSSFLVFFAFSSLLCGYTTTFYNVLIIYRVPNLFFAISLASCLLRLAVLCLSYFHKNPYYLVAGEVLIESCKLILLHYLVASKSTIPLSTLIKLTVKELFFAFTGIAVIKSCSDLFSSPFANVVSSFFLYVVMLYFISSIFKESKFGYSFNMLKTFVKKINFNFKI